MTVSSTTNSQSFACNGATTVFTLPFRVLESTAVRGYLTLISTGVITPLVNGTDFTVAGVGEENTQVTTAATYSALYQLRFTRITERLQETDYRDNDPFPAESHETALDRLTMIVQEDAASLERTIRAPEGETLNALPSAADRASKLIGFNSSGKMVVSAPADGTASALALSLAGTTLAAEGGGMVGFGPTVSYPLGTIGAKMRERLSVADFGAVGDGVADDTAAFTGALTESDWVYVPEGTYLLDGLYLDFDQRLYGPGTIKTSGGTEVALHHAHTKNTGLRIMFMEGNLPSFEELLHIKSLGYSCVMAYPWNIDRAVLLKNCEAVGLSVLMHGGFTTVPVTVTPYVTYDARPSVIGYYLCDEPVLNGDDVTDQDRAINAYRAVTSKPLFCAENSVIYNAASISPKWDVILSDVYYANSLVDGDEAVVQAIRNYAEYRAHAPNARVLPLVGLFNDTGFAKATALVTQLAEHLVKFSPNGDFAVFVWDAGTTPGAYDGVRNTPAYLESAASLPAIASACQPWVVRMVPFGTFGGNSDVLACWEGTRDGASPGLEAAPYVVPWDVKNVGSATDSRQQNFADSGLMCSATGGTMGFRGMPAGLCGGVFTWRNYENANTATVSIGYSANGGYEFTAVDTSSALATTGSEPLAGELSTNLAHLPMIRVTLSGSVTAPYGFISGYMAFSNVPSVSF